MAAFRSPVSALMVGVSVWCAAGTIAVASSDHAAVRMAVPAAWWWLAAPALLALLVPGWRGNPLLAAPALLSTLPWWPVPVPAVAMLWTGPLAWVPIAVALAAGLVTSARPGGSAAGDAAGAARRRPSPWPAALATLVLASATAASIAPRVPGGDEPHYLIITQSLLQDGDLRIENNHEQRDYGAYFGGNLRPDFVTRGRDGEIYSIHAPGVSVLVLPGFALFGYEGARATVILAAAATGGLIWLAAWMAAGRRDAAWFGWAAVVGSTTFLLQSGMVFPDGVGALGIAAAMWLWMKLVRAENVSTRALVLAGAALATLPWLHTRFTLLSGGFGAALVWVLWRDRSAPLARVAAFLVVPLASAIAWFGFFHLTYGTPNPAAPYGGGAGARLAYVPGGLLALAFDQQFGLLTYAPVLALAVVGMRVARPEVRLAARAPMLILLAYAAAVATYWMWWAGLPATPARFLAAVLPVLAVPVALAWTGAGPRGRVVSLLLLIVSLAISAVTIGVGRGQLAWNGRDAQALWLEWLGPVVNLPRAWPSFFWRLAPDDLTTEWPFAVHAGAWTVAVSGVVALAVWWLRTRRSSARRPVVVAAVGAAAMAGLMLASQVGWWLNGVSGLDPARSQLAIMLESARGRLAWQVSPFDVRRVDDVRGTLRVSSEEPGREDANPPLALLANVPPGRYELLLQDVPEGISGQLLVRIGRSPQPLRIVSVTSSGRSPTIWLPAGAQALVVEPDAQLTEVGGRVAVVPVDIERTGKPLALARVSKRYPGGDVFPLDQGAFVEPAGFWIRGATTAGFVIAPDAGRAPIPILLRNGAVANEVEVWTPLGVQTFAMEPGEERIVPLPAPGTGRALDLRVRSEKGFRPSDVSASDDRRFLGVWMEMVGQ